MSKLLVSVLGVWVALGAERAGAAPCPSNCIEIWPRPPICSTAASRETVTVTSYLRYDLAVAFLEARLYSSGVSANNVAAQDMYVIDGLPPGMPLTIRALYRVSGLLSGGGPDLNASVAAQLRHADAQVYASWSSADNPIVDSVLELPIPCAAGEPFLVKLNVGTSIDGPGANRFAQARINASLRFTDLPPGASVTSCQGFMQQQPVPTRTETWGELKAAYRQ